jgi:hypothetical protein
VKYILTELKNKLLLITYIPKECMRVESLNKCVYVLLIITCQKPTEPDIENKKVTNGYC